MTNTAIFLLVVSLLSCVMSQGETPASAGRCGPPAARNWTTCTAYFEGYFYTAPSDTCKQVGYSGCTPDPNSFSTSQACEKTCLKKDICLLPKSAGPCHALMFRFFYHSQSGTCKTFIYGGCQGNGNNFKTKAECEKKCVKKDWGCEFRGTQYSDGESFLVACNICHCRRGKLSCTEIHCPDSCPEGWRRYGNQCYYMDVTRRRYDGAERACRDTPGAAVVTPRSPGENLQLHRFIEQLKPNSKHFWVGLTAQFSWNDGTQLKPWTNWRKGQPRQCTMVRLMDNNRLEWSSVSCHVKSSTVCQLSLMSV